MTTPIDLAGAVQAMVAAVRDAAPDPADQVRALLALVASAAPDATDSRAERITRAMCRRAALAGLARATAEYLPASYDDAIAIRDLVADALRAEELVAANDGQITTFGALHAMRLAVAQDLTARAANLAHLRTVTTPAPMPALAAAYALYGDATRAGELTASPAVASPLFLPTTFTALSE